jgi:nitrate reductase gamma subunit
LPKDSIYFHLVEVVAILVFSAGVAANLAFWSLGTAGSPEASRVGKLGRLLSDLIQALFRRGGWRRLLVRVLLQTQLFRENKYRWISHMCLTWGTVELFFVGSLGNMLVDLHIIDLSKDAGWFALVNDLGGVALLLGIALAGYRRYYIKERQVITIGEDGLVLGWLFALTAGGFLLNAVRILAEGVPATLAGYSFVAYGVAFVFNSLAVDWVTIHRVMWWLHVILAFGLVAYLPYSKLWHIVTSPISIVMGTQAERPLA